MNKIQQAFSQGKAFIPFVTAGDPSLPITKQLLLAMQEAGADLIEIGIPFSDPIAEGLVIQAANERALANGCTIDQIFAMVASIKDDIHVPLVFLTYINPIFTYGKEKFMRNCLTSGISGLIIPDLPFEEKEELAHIAKANNISIISLIAPVSAERIEMIAKAAEGFIYCVSSLGVTGVREQIKTDIGAMIERVRKVSEIPCAIGFGIATSKQAKEMASLSDGAIVGSAIVKLVAQYKEDCVAPVKAYVKEMKQAVME